VSEKLPGAAVIVSVLKYLGAGLNPLSGADTAVMPAGNSTLPVAP